MPNDQVTIDPEFLPPPSRLGQSRWLVMGAVAAAAFMLGWLLRSPTSGEPVTMQLATSTTGATRATTEPLPSSTTASPATSSAPVGLEVPSGEAVPGFGDAVTIAMSGGIWGEEVDIIQWRPSQPQPETIVSFRGDDPDGWVWFVGLDAAGTWYAVEDEHDVLTVRPVASFLDEEGGWEPGRETVGLRVIGASWHDTAPGRLAWLSCPRAVDGPATLHTLDVADRSAEPVALARFHDACDEFPLWINGWGDWGFALEGIDDWAVTGWEEPNAWTVLLDPGGAELIRLEHGPGGRSMVAAGPGGTVWNEERLEGPPHSFLLSLDGRRRTSVPGLDENEWVEQAQWSPDGSRIALVLYSPQVDRTLLRIVEAGTGEIDVEIDELGPVVQQTRWSSDGNFLLIGHDRDDGGAAGAALVVYDTTTAAVATEQPLRELHHFMEIRTFEPSSIAVQFTPVAWGIDLEEAWGPGVYTISLVVDASPLLPDLLESLSGKLIWTDTVVELCNIGIDEINGSFVQFGDTFQTIEGCGANPNAMQEAFDELGLPELACLGVGSGGIEHEYCAPLT